MALLSSAAEEWQETGKERSDDMQFSASGRICIQGRYSKDTASVHWALSIFLFSLF